MSRYLQLIVFISTLFFDQAYCQDLNPPQNLFYHNNCNEVMLCWSSPDSSLAILTGYNIYKNGVFFANTTDTCHQSNLEAGLYFFEVSALYDLGESDSIPISFILPDYEAPADLEYSINDTGAVVLHWNPVFTSSVQNNDWLYYDDGVNLHGVGTCDCFLFTAIRFDSAMLVPYYETYATHIQFHSYQNAVESWYNVRVWEGENSPDLIHKQAVGHHFIDKWNTLRLNKSLSLYNKKELWFGMKIWAVTGEHPLSQSDDDGVIGFGDMISMYTAVSWESISLYGSQFAHNWNIRVVLTSDTLNQSIFLGYRVYNNGEKVNAIHITDTSFIVPAEFIHDYNRFAVTTNYISCESDSAILIFFPTEIPENIQTELKIFPNPTHGKVEIQSIRPLVSINVYHISGQLAKTFSLSGNYAEIDLSGFPPACYILHIETKGGTPFNEMLILQ